MAAALHTARRAPAMAPAALLLLSLLSLYGCVEVEALSNGVHDCEDVPGHGDRATLSPDAVPTLVLRDASNAVVTSYTPGGSYKLSLAVPAGTVRGAADAAQGVCGGAVELHRMLPNGPSCTHGRSRVRFTPHPTPLPFHLQTFRGYIAATFAGAAAPPPSFAGAQAGSLAPPDSAAQPQDNCAGGVTHKTNSDKTSALWAWTPPAGGGTVTAHAVVVFTQDSFTAVSLTIPQANAEPSATGSATASPPATPSGTAAVTPSPSATGSPSPSGTGPPSDSPSGTPTPSGTRTPSGTPSPSGTGTPPPSGSATPTAKRTGSRTGTVAYSPVSTRSSTATSSASVPPSASRSPSSGVSPSNTQFFLRFSFSSTRSATATPTASKTRPPPWSSSRTGSYSRSGTASVSRTASRTRSTSRSRTRTRTRTPSRTPSPKLK
jgi:hypothetical protein